jgi:hypothetical protein
MPDKVSNFSDQCDFVRVAVGAGLIRILSRRSSSRRLVPGEPDVSCNTRRSIPIGDRREMG